MTPAARHQAAIEVLDRIGSGEPAEAALTRWARGARYAGSGDRAAVRDLVFTVLRRWRSLAALGGDETGRGRILGLLRESGTDPAEVFTGQGHAPAPLSPTEISAGTDPDPDQALDLPDWLIPIWRDALGRDAATIARALRDRAPVMVRVNLRKTDRATAITTLAEAGILAEPVAISPTALRITEGARRLAASPAYLAGLVELQDGASQAIVDEVYLASDRSILDFCAGGGGKTLALAARSDAVILAHDHNPQRMADLPARASRAGARIDILAGDALDARAPFDLVLADAPCSGSGAWRRAPEARWRLTQAALDQLTRTQDAILARAATLVAPDGRLAYATCSVLDCENDARVDAFLAAHDGWCALSRRNWHPGAEGDGFYLAILSRTCGKGQPQR